MNELNRMFQKFNTEFWKGRLPRYRVTYYQFPADTLNGKCLSVRKLIRIARGLPSEKLRPTLLHEMCHIGCPYHGKKFIERLDRLAKMGEEWAKEEGEMYRDSEPWHAMVSDMVDSLSLVTMREEVPTYRAAVLHFSRDFAVTPAQFKRKFPWFKSAYKKAVQAGIEYRQLRAARGQ